MNRLVIRLFEWVSSQQERCRAAPWRRFKQFLSRRVTKHTRRQNKDGEIRLFLAHKLNKGTLITSFPMKMKLNQKKRKENWKLMKGTHTPLFFTPASERRAATSQRSHTSTKCDHSFFFVLQLKKNIVSFYFLASPTVFASLRQP